MDIISGKDNLLFALNDMLMKVEGLSGLYEYYSNEFRKIEEQIKCDSNKIVFNNKTRGLLNKIESTHNTLSDSGFWVDFFGELNCYLSYKSYVETIKSAINSIRIIIDLIKQEIFLIQKQRVEIYDEIGKIHNELNLSISKTLDKNDILGKQFNDLYSIYECINDKNYFDKDINKKYLEKEINNINEFIIYNNEEFQKLKKNEYYLLNRNRKLDLLKSTFYSLKDKFHKLMDKYRKDLDQMLLKKKDSYKVLSAFVNEDKRYKSEINVLINRYFCSNDCFTFKKFNNWLYSL